MSETVSPPDETIATPSLAPKRRFAWIVPTVALIWLPIMLWASYGSIHSSGGGSIAVATAAQALPGVVQATFAAAIAAGLLAGGSRAASTPRWRWILATAGGLLIGLVAAAVILIVYGHGGGLASVEITVVVVGLLGGALSGLGRLRTTVFAGLAGLITALIIYRILVARNVLTHTIKWFGAGDTVQSFLTASTRVAYANSAVAGLLAGWVAYRVLRRWDPAARFPKYQLAGAFAGLALLVSELATRLGGANLLDVVKSISPEDRTLFDLVRPANINNDLIVVFFGAVVALIAFGRSLPGRSAAMADVDQTVSTDDAEPGGDGRSSD